MEVIYDSRGHIKTDETSLLLYAKSPSHASMVTYGEVVGEVIFLQELEDDSPHADYIFGISKS